MKSSLEKSGEPVKKNGFQVSPHKVNVTKNSFPLIGTGTLKMQSRGASRIRSGQEPSIFTYWVKINKNSDVKKLNINKAKNEFGYKVATSLEEGVQKTIDWYMKKN